MSSPESFYEVQASIVNDNSLRGYSDDNNDGKVGLDEDGDYLEWADTPGEPLHARTAMPR